MRDYSIVSAKFWIGETGKSLRGNKDAQILALYLVTSPHALLTGLYYCPIYYIAQDTGLDATDVTAALEALRGAGYCVYDEDTETVFVFEMARYQVAPQLELRDNRRTAIVRELEKMPAPLVQLFVDKYGEAFKLDEAIFPKTIGWRPGVGVLRSLTERDGRFCQLCKGTEELAVDHVIARINGGSNELTNLRFLCRSCNSKKSAEDRETFWGTVISGLPYEGQGVPLRKGRVATLRSQDQDHDQEQEPKEKGGPLTLALAGPDHNPLEDLDERQLEAFRALQSIKFRTTTLGPVTADKVVKDVIGLARNLGGDAFPAVASVKQQLAMAAAYLDANPKKAKTPDGLARFLMTWFKNEQNTPHGGGYSRQPWKGGSNEVEQPPRKRVDLTAVVAKLGERLDRE